MGSSYTYNPTTNKLKVVDKNFVIKSYFKTYSVSYMELTPKDQNKIYKSSYSDLLKIMKYSVEVNKNLKFFQGPFGEIIIVGVDTNIDKIKSWLKSLGYNTNKMKIEETKYYIMNAETGSYVRRYDDLGTPPIKSTQDKKEAKIYDNLQNAINECKEMDKYNVGDFVVMDITTDKAVEGLNYN